jgi:hypothetical protein
VDEAALAFSLLGGLDVRSEVGSVSEQPLTDNEFFPDFGQVFVQIHHAQSELVRLFEHYVFCHRPSLLFPSISTVVSAP